MHYIQEYILQKLKNESLSFAKINDSEFRTDLFSYHLKELVKNKSVSKNNLKYEITQKGLNELYTQTHKSSNQGLDVILLLIIERINSKNKKEYLFIKRNKEPFKNEYAFIAGTALKQLKLEDSIKEIAVTKFGVKINSVNFVGITHEIILKDSNFFSDQIVFVYSPTDFQLPVDKVDKYFWFSESEINNDEFIYDTLDILELLKLKSRDIFENTYNL